MGAVVAALWYAFMGSGVSMAAYKEDDDDDGGGGAAYQEELVPLASAEAPSDSHRHRL